MDELPIKVSCHKSIVPLPLSEVISRFISFCSQGPSGASAL